MINKKSFFFLEMAESTEYTQQHSEYTRPEGIQVGELLCSNLASTTSGQSSSASSITLVTQLSWDRRSQLVKTVSSWKLGRCVAAVWLPRDCAAEARLLHERLEVLAAGEDSCAVDLVLVWVSSQHPRYPINALRNMALAHASTDLVLLSDVDQQPSRNTSLHLHSGDMLALLWRWCCQERELLVIPAFHMHPETEEIPETAFTKPGLLRLLLPKREPQHVIASGGSQGSGGEAERDLSVNPRMVSFQSSHYPKGHGPTQAATRWAACENHEGYKVEYEEGYEPYVIACRWLVAAYDERYSGYGRNKVTQSLANLVMK